MTGEPRTVLHYLGYNDDAGGIVSVVRALAVAGRFDCVLGLNAGARQRRSPPLPAQEFPKVAGERIGPLNFWRARRVALAVRGWLREDPRRIFHGHSRAGLLVALWLRKFGEGRVVASVHCYGRQRWFYRWAARRLGPRIFWLTPEMRRHYGVDGDGWEQCLPGGVTPDYFALAPAPAVPGRLRLGGAGEISDRKRWDIVVSALKLLGPQTTTVTFEHIGAIVDSGVARVIQQSAARAGLGEKITWCGPESSSHRLLASVDLLVVPSPNEPYSMILQEALAAGVPVVASDAGGPHDVLVPGRSGWLFRPDHADELADVLRARIQSRDWETMDRTAIRATARRADVAAAEWGKVYEWLCAWRRVG